VEERKINPETISKDVQKKEFARFTEDYNTGKKYNHLVCCPGLDYHFLQRLYHMKSTIIWRLMNDVCQLYDKANIFLRQMTCMTSMPT